MRLPRDTIPIQPSVRSPLPNPPQAPATETIDAYARAIRRIGAHFDYRIDELCDSQLLDYFTDLLSSHSWGAVKLDLYGLKFYYTYVLGRPCTSIDLVKSPKGQRSPDIVTLEEAKWLFEATETSATGCCISPWHA